MFSTNTCILIAVFVVFTADIIKCDDYGIICQDPNASKGCYPAYCHNRCGVKDPPFPCDCKRVACVCNDGYRYSSKRNKCVLESQCDS